MDNSENDLTWNSKDAVDRGLAVGSMMIGIGGYHIGSHMQGRARFSPIVTMKGKVLHPGTSMYRFGPVPGSYANTLGAGLRIGGTLFGLGGMGYTIYNMATGNVTTDQGLIDLGMGAISLLGLPGMAITAGYYSLGLFLRYGESADLMNEINSNVYNGVWFGAHTHFK